MPIVPVVIVKNLVCTECSKALLYEYKRDWEINIVELKFMLREITSYVLAYYLCYKPSSFMSKNRNRLYIRSLCLFMSIDIFG